MNKIKILIVEDEFIIAQDIELRLTELGFIIEESVSNVKDAVHFLENNEVDIAIVDIALDDDENGIDLAKIINKRFKFPFIFLTSTANEETIAEAKSVNPAAYLLKPFNDKQLKVSIEMALANYYEPDSKEENDTEQANSNSEMLLKMPTALFLKKGNHYEKVPYEDILWLEADSNYTFIYTKNDKFTYSTVLKRFEDKLPNDIFFRIHRSYIVNLNSITGFEGNMLRINDKKIPVNKANRDAVFKRFEVI